MLCVPGEADTDLVNSDQLRGRLAVARRGGCSFQEKTQRVESAGARGLVIVNTDNALLTADAPGFCAGIPVVMIRAKDEAAILTAGNSSCLRPMAQAGPPLFFVIILIVEVIIIFVIILMGVLYFHFQVPVFGDTDILVTELPTENFCGTARTRSMCKQQSLHPGEKPDARYAEQCKWETLFDAHLFDAVSCGCIKKSCICGQYDCIHECNGSHIYDNYRDVQLHCDGDGVCKCRDDKFVATWLVLVVPLFLVFFILLPVIHCNCCGCIPCIAEHTVSERDFCLAVREKEREKRRREIIEEAVIQRAQEIKRRREREERRRRVREENQVIQRAREIMRARGSYSP
jgi:hypothetical protein